MLPLNGDGVSGEPTGHCGCRFLGDALQNPQANQVHLGHDSCLRALLLGFLGQSLLRFNLGQFRIGGRFT